MSDFKYLPLDDIPPEIHEAASALFQFFEKSGMRGWQFSHVADRRLVVDLERQIEKLKNEKCILKREIRKRL